MPPSATSLDGRGLPGGDSGQLPAQQPEGSQDGEVTLASARRRHGELDEYREPEDGEDAGQHLGGAVDPGIAGHAVRALVSDDARRLLD